MQRDLHPVDTGVVDTPRRYWRRFTACLMLLLWVAVAGDGRAVSTRVWRNDTYADFAAGEGKGVWVTSKGKLEVGLVFRRAPLKGVSFVFSMLESKGRVFLGTGNEGELWVAKRGRVRKLAVLKGAVVVTSLAVSSKGEILAATLPEGKIFAVDPQTGKNRVFCKLDAKHIWSMVRDPKTNALMVGTGPQGKLFRVKANGQATLYWDSDERHLLSLAPGPGRALYVGTAPKAMVFRLLGKKRARVIHDFDGTEVRALAGNGRVLFAAVNKMEPAKIGYPKLKAEKKGGTKIKSRKVPGRKSRRKVPRKGAKKGKGGVFRIWPSGAVEQLHGLKKSYFTALEMASKNRVYAAEGKRGQVFLLSTESTLATVADVKERQVLALNLSGKQPALATGDGGSYYTPRKKGKHHYLSDVLDAGSASRWGRLFWKGDAPVRLETRTGNTAKPDDGWSRWRTVSGRLRVFGARGGPVASPPGRYFQYRVVWRGARKGTLDAVSLHYMPINRRARISELCIAGQPEEDEKTKIQKASWLKKITLNAPEKQKISWKVKNPDGDPLWYRVWYRAVGQAVWRRIGGPEPLTGTAVKWNTGNLPDGRYLIRVKATDARANAAGRVLSHTRISTPFLVDNTKPVVKGLAVRYPRVRGLAVDGYSRIVGIQYSLDGKTWYPVDPVDGVFDGTSEGFSFRVQKKLESGPHILLLRVFDAAGNAGVSKVAVRIP